MAITSGSLPLKKQAAYSDYLINIHRASTLPSGQISARANKTALDEIKTHLRGAKIVLRSKTPDLVRQEFYGLLMAHFAVRALMHEAALTANVDTDRLSFIHAVRVVRRKLSAFNAIPSCRGKPFMSRCSKRFCKNRLPAAAVGEIRVVSNEK